MISISKKLKKTDIKLVLLLNQRKIQDKFSLISSSTKNVLDIGCAPGSWIQYTIAQLKKLKISSYQVIGFDLKKVELNLPGLSTYVQDVTDIEKVKEILKNHSDFFF